MRDANEKNLLKCLEKHYGSEYEIQIRDVTKLSQEPLRGLTIRKKSVAIAPIIYLDNFSGMSVEDTLKKIYSIIDSSDTKKLDFPVQSFMNWNEAKSNIYARLVSADDALLNELPHRNYLDLAIVYYFVVDTDEDLGHGTITIRLEHLSHWGIGESELYEAAKANAEAEGYTTENIMDILQEACGESSTVCTDNGPSVSDNSMYVISNHVKFYGATALIFAKECFKALAEKMDSNLYILPSSQHELIAISEEIADPQSLKEMVCDINNSNVDEKDRLSYCVYKFCRKTETIEVAA